MKLFAAADIHGAQYRLNIILGHIEVYRPDLVIICGDITQFGPGEMAKNFLNQIPVETFAIPGNIDTPDVGQAISESNALNIDRRRLVRNGVSFVGLGGERFSRPSDLVIVDDTIKKPIADVLDANSVLVTHVPPYQLQDTVFLGHHTGNKELRDIVETCQPRLVLCGHIHEDPGMTKFGKSTIVNCSIGKRTEGAVINIDDGISVEILE